LSVSIIGGLSHSQDAGRLIERLLRFSAYSGGKWGAAAKMMELILTNIAGLDTSTILVWLVQQGYEVVVRLSPVQEALTKIYKTTGLHRRCWARGKLWRRGKKSLVAWRRTPGRGRSSARVCR
jgi:hypothetical protein